MSDMLVAPSTIVTANETRTVPRSHQPGPSPRGSTLFKPPVSPTRSAHPRSSTAPAWPTRPFPPELTTSR